MRIKSILNTLELAYSPLSAYEFAYIKDDPLIELAIEDANIYLIGQRPIITFENFMLNSDEDAIIFEIHQKGNHNIVRVKFSLLQPNLPTSLEDDLAISYKHIDKNKYQEKFPLYNLQWFSLSKMVNGDKVFIAWFSPEKLLQNWWKGQIECDVQGDFQSFLNYKVHYVGKATKQSILKRLTGHSTFQDILSIEKPIIYKDLPSYEIVILMFEFEDNLQISNFGIDSCSNEMVDTVLGKNFPSLEKLSLDAEKALINAMQPNYNKEMFKKYPISKDGLFSDNYDYISYSFVDPITLIYPDGEIVGRIAFQGGDKIVIMDNKTFDLIKFK